MQFITLIKSMNQKTLQTIYKTSETEEYFRRYLVELGCREDKRKTEEHRVLKMTTRDNSAVVSAGQTIIIAHLQTEVQNVTFSPVSQSFGEPLLKLQVTSSLQNRQRENKVDRAIEEFLSRQINWSDIERQLVVLDASTGKQYAFVILPLKQKGNLTLRVLGDDGGVTEHALLALQVLLATTKFKKLTVNKEKVEFGETYKLQLTKFLFPLKYCCIGEHILSDPSLSEQSHYNLMATIVSDLLQVERAPFVSHHSKKHNDREEQERLLKLIMQRWEKDLGHIKVSFSRMMSQLEQKNQFMLTCSLRTESE